MASSIAAPPTEPDTDNGPAIDGTGPAFSIIQKWRHRTNVRVFTDRSDERSILLTAHYYASITSRIHRLDPQGWPEVGFIPQWNIQMFIMVLAPWWRVFVHSNF